MIAIGARTAESLEPVARELEAAAVEAGRGAGALRVVRVPVEVSDPASVAAAAELVRGAVPGGRLDVVVQNAGVSGEFAGILDADPEGWWRVYEVNVRGQYLVARYFLPLLLEEGEGEAEAAAGRGGGLKTFVTVASVGAHLRTPGASQYQPGKLANVRFAEFVDAEFGGRGVSAWCVHPGNVLTDMIGGPEGDTAKTMGESECKQSTVVVEHVSFFLFFSLSVPGNIC